MKTKPHYVLYKHMHGMGVKHFYIELIEHFPCNDTYELKAREGHYIRQIGTLNMLIAGITHKEWAGSHKEQIQQYVMKTINMINSNNIKNIIKNILSIEQNNIMKTQYKEHKQRCSLYNNNYYTNNSEDLKTLRKNKYNDTK